MDFSQLLKHCRDEHGVEVDTSKLGELMRFAIFQYFNQEHNLPLLEGETWEIFEQLQKVRTIGPGFPTGIEAADGQMICVGDEVGYMEEEDSAVFTVVFHDGAFRKKYHHWPAKDFWPEMQRPREAGPEMKIIKKAETIPDHGTGLATVFQDIAETRQKSREKEGQI